MADVTIEATDFETVFMANMWRSTVADGAQQLSAALQSEIPVEPNRFIERDGRIAACLSPGRYLILADAGTLYERVREQCDPELISMVQLDHSREAFRLEGQQAAKLLMKGVAIDLDETRFPVGSLFQSSIHDIGLTALKRGSSSFDLLVYNSFADSFCHWLFDAAMEFS
ncbi:sarcosine oxidase subunit gamma [Altererythrobacter sp. MF3-039]|uniref:sarcosine oxidase subunit gamma n=1 Tax=Altererythrobacter sp. MF3-039 TaxID=3252901 RepID=UPI00390C8441